MTRGVCKRGSNDWNSEARQERYEGGIQEREGTLQAWGELDGWGG